MRGFFVALLGFAISCAERTLPGDPQVVLFVDTDAPVAPLGSLLPATDPTPLFGRLEIAIFRPGESEPCSGCVRIFSVTDVAFREGRVSIGVPVRAAEAGTRARLRLFRGNGSGPRPRSTLESVVILPPTSAPTEAHVVLSMNDLDAPRGTLSEPIPALAGPPLASKVGSWPGTPRVRCAGAAPEGTACIPGGAFWMGASDEDPRDERLVILSPFFLDTTEVTTAAYLGAGGTFKTPPRDAPNTEATDYCTAARGPSSLPMNCVTREAAQAYCSARGARLPTEAELEYVASNFRGDAFPWGPEAPRCSDGVFSRLETLVGPTACTREDRRTFPPGPAPVDRVRDAERDAVELPTGTVFDLAGNLMEMVSDEYQSRGGPFWSDRRTFRDPVCPTREVPNLLPVRGGSYSYPRSAQDSRGDRQGESFTRGFRCARPAR